jgi:hypothetical protein
MVNTHLLTWHHIELATRFVFLTLSYALAGTSTQTYTHTHTHIAHTYTHTHTYTHKHAQTHTLTHIHIQTHTHTHKPTHTHTYRRTIPLSSLPPLPSLPLRARLLTFNNAMTQSNTTGLTSVRMSTTPRILLVQMRTPRLGMREWRRVVMLRNWMRMLR